MHVGKVLAAKGSMDVHTISEQATVQDFVDNVCGKGIGALLVTKEDGSLAGILTERDILHACSRKLDFSTTRVGDIMTKELLTLNIDDDIHVAMDMMISGHVRHLPVLVGGRLSGLIDIRDILLAMRRMDQAERGKLVRYLQDELEKRGPDADDN